MRELTKAEFDNKPSWANSYDIQAQSGEPIFYAEKDGGAMPINEKNVFESQQQEIADLKLAVQFQYNAAMTLDEENQIARKEIAELKAALHLAVTKPMQPLINHRFKENKIVRHCLDAGGTDLNKIAMLDFSVEDAEQFAQLIGYSLGGYADLSYVTDESYYRAEKQSKGKS